MAGKAVIAAIIAENTFTDWIMPKFSLYEGEKGTHFLNISISGTWVGSVTLQRRFSSSDTPRDVEIFTENAEEALYDHESGVEYRLGINLGAFVSGICNVRLGA